MPHARVANSGRMRVVNGISRNVNGVGSAFMLETMHDMTSIRVVAMLSHAIVGDTKLSAKAMPAAKARQRGSIGVFIRHALLNKLGRH